MLHPLTDADGVMGMEEKSFEERMLECGTMLSMAQTVDAQENWDAVACFQPFFGFGRLVMRRTDAAHGQVLRELVYYEDEREVELHPFEFTSKEYHGVDVTYLVYPAVGEPFWTGAEARKLMFCLMMLHQANERQELVHDSIFYRYHDPQTHHTNMNFYADRCDEYIKNHTIADYTALAVNLSNFTNLNLKIGSGNCDTVLVKYMNLLKGGLDEDEVVSRYSGDQFALLIHKEHLDQILEILRGVNIQYGPDKQDVVLISAEAGIYNLHNEVSNYHHIIQAISSALNTAKNSIQLQFAYYDRSTVDSALRRKYFESQFEKALKHEDIQIYFQPKVSLKDYELIGAEALSRWIVDGKVVPPDSFIPILEETSRICQLDFYVLEHVCRSMHSWISHGVKPVKVSVNFSRRHLSNQNLVREIVAVLDRYEVPHQYLEVELTETTIDADFEALKSLVYELRENGIEASVDDFGTGYSSLSLIRDVPFKVLKIDKSFLGDANMQSARERSMIKHVISMASDLGMYCICEGVESMEHVQLLKENKCYMAQGYFFNRPLPQDEFEQVLLG